MQTLLSAEEMMQCDGIAARSFGIPGLLLMENAGLGVARWIQQRFSLENKTIVVFCGKGNNGGDGLVAARHLTNTPARIEVLLLDTPARGDAGVNAAILRKIARNAPDRISIRPVTPSVVSSLHPDIIIDAILGTGFSGSLGKKYASIVQWINGQSVPRISIDIPSGIHGTTGAGTVAVKADITLTLGAIKSGLICNAGRERSGTVEVLDIGIPKKVLSNVTPPTHLVELRDIAKCLPPRASTAHKYSVGKVFVLGGSRGYTGAPVLTAMSALRSGAGAVVLGVPESIYTVVARKVTEVIVEPLPATQEGSLAANGIEAIRKRLDWADVTVMGPGLSQNTETASLVESLFLQASGNVLVDADALTGLAKTRAGISILRKTKATCIITPHTGEFAQITGMSAEEIELFRIQHARSIAKKLGVFVVLKGAPTVTADPDGSVYVNSTGNPGMATVGMGDVLSGLIAGLWAQGADVVRACYGGVYLHGLSGDAAARELGERSLVASDVIKYLPEAIVSAEKGQ